MKEPAAAKIGFLVALSVPALAGGLLTPIINGKPDWQMVIGLFPALYFYSALFSLPFAIPAYLFAKRNKLISWWSTIITGLAIGGLVARWIQGYIAPGIFIWSGVGGASGFVFWFIWKHHKEEPQKDGLSLD